jgi:hypothetical protein
MPIRLHAFQPALAPAGWLVFAALLALFAIEIVRLSVGDVLSDSNPELAIMFDPGQSAARVMLSQRTYLEDISRLDDASAGAREALDHDPLTPDALTLLGRFAQEKDDDRQAAELMRLASRVNLRSLEPQIWLLDRDIRRGDVAPALQRIDVLFRGQTSGSLDPLILALAPALTSEPYRRGFVALLRTNPKWRASVLGELAAKSSDFPGLNALFSALQSGDSPPTSPELAAFLTRLISGGMLDQAYLAWIRSLPPERLRRPDYLYNARFQYALTNLPFDWVFAPVSGALIGVRTENGRRILDVDFFGSRVSFQNVSHLLTLAPGPYRLSGLERSENLQNERGLWWRLFCVGKPADSLAVTDLLTGDQPWRDFTVDFEVPRENCPYQELILELPARVALETEIIGGVSYTNLEIKTR